jgi:hypothetical protein
VIFCGDLDASVTRVSCLTTGVSPFVATFVGSTTTKILRRLWRGPLSTGLVRRRTPEAVVLYSQRGLLHHIAVSRVSGPGAEIELYRILLPSFSAMLRLEASSTIPAVRSTKQGEPCGHHVSPAL